MNSESTSFDPNSFLDATITESFTERPPLPPGDYHAVIGDVTQRSGERKDGEGKWYSLNIPLSVEVPMALVEEIGQPKVVVFDSVFLDITSSGALDTAPGKNRRLKAYREALDMNKQGQPFGPRMMIGRRVLVKIAHRDYQGKTQEQVDGVASIG